MAIKLFNFKGRRPLVAPRLLPVGYAQTAQNVVMGSGAMMAAKALGAAVANPTNPKTIYKFGSSWLSFAARTWIVPAAISGVSRILLCDGDGALYAYPVQRATNGDVRRWGVAKPTTALTCNPLGDASADGLIADSVSYVYTLVTAYGEESDVFTASAVVDLPVGQYISLTNWCAYAGNKAALLSSTGNDYEFVRVYRISATADGSAEYQRVSMRSSVSGPAVQDIPVADISAADDPWYDVDAAQTGLSQDLGAVLQTEGWDPPPALLKNALMFANGMYAGSVGALVYLSVPGYYYAFPASGVKDYTIECAHDVVAMAAFNDSIVVGTAGFPAVISGTDPAYMTLDTLPYQQPCLSGKGMVSLPDGVAYPSPDGLFFVGSGGGRVLTANIFDRDAWAALPLSAMMSVYFNQRIYMFFEGYSTGIVYDPVLDYVTDISLGSYTAKDVWVDPVADVLYVATAEDVFAWEGHATDRLLATWKSGILETPPVNFSAMRVMGTFPEGHTTSVSYFVDGAVKHTQAITDSNPFRLPSGFRGRDHEITISFSKSTINAIYVGSSLQELADV